MVNITMIICSHITFCIVVLVWIKIMIFLLNETIYVGDKFRDGKNEIFQCYSYDNIDTYGNLHKVCNSFSLNNSKYFNLTINKPVSCNEDCPTFTCIDDTEIKVIAFHEIEIVKFNKCFENVDKNYFKYECVGIGKCDSKEYDTLLTIQNWFVLSLFFVFIVGLFFMAGSFVILVDANENYSYSDCCQKYIIEKKKSPENIESPPVKDDHVITIPPPTTINSRMKLH